MSFNRRKALTLLSSAPILGLLFGCPSFAFAQEKLSSSNSQSKGKVLFVLTSHEELGNTGKKTGYWLSEVTHPWIILKNAGYTVDFVSPKGGKCPYEGTDANDQANREFAQDILGQKKLNLSMKPEEVKPEDYQAIFFVGGHGAMWDFPDNKKLAEITARIYENGGAVAAVSHGVAGLLNVKLANGKFLIAGKKINAFTNSEEKTVALDKVMPFSLETKISQRGAKFECSDNFQPHVVVNDRVITGQNPMSSKAVGNALVNILQH